MIFREPEPDNYPVFPRPYSLKNFISLRFRVYASRDERGGDAGNDIRPGVPSRLMRSLWTCLTEGTTPEEVRRGHACRYHQLGSG